MVNSNEVVKFDNVSFCYSKDKMVFNNVTLSILKGEFFFITGVSGAGKTSLIKLIYMETKQSSGAIKLFGRSADMYHSVELRKKIGVVLQRPLLMQHLTIIENVLLPFKISGEDVSVKRQEALELLNWVGLKNCIDKYPKEISVGEQHCASIARAVITKPALILADEPTGNVDNETSKKINNLFLALNKLGTTVLFATHKMQDIQYLQMPYFNIIDGSITKVLQTMREYEVAK